MWADVLFTFLIMLGIYWVVRITYISHRTFVVVSRYSKTIDEQSITHKKIVSDLKKKGIDELERLNKNLDTMQEKCLMDITKRCTKCKDCPYKRGGQ